MLSCEFQSADSSCSLRTKQGCEGRGRLILFKKSSFCRLNSCLVYSAGQLYAAQVTPSPFLTTSATNGVDILATAVAMPLADYWGRKPSMMLFYIISAISYFIIGLISNCESKQDIGFSYRPTLFRFIQFRCRSYTTRELD